jgi:hypothetical protein
MEIRTGIKCSVSGYVSVRVIGHTTKKENHYWVLLRRSGKFAVDRTFILNTYSRRPDLKQ